MRGLGNDVLSFSKTSLSGPCPTLAHVWDQSLAMTYTSNYP